MGLWVYTKVMAPLPAAPPLVLTIAGFDPTAGAGVLADIKAIAANQAYGLACIAALTVQTTSGVQAYEAVSAKMLERQLEALLSELSPRAVKIGMLGNRANVEAVARQLELHPLPWVVLDPVRQASLGTVLMDEGGWEALRKQLIPRVNVLTPNLDETEALTGIRPTKPAEFEQAALKLSAMGPRYIIIKGGHAERPSDVLYDGEKFVTLTADRVRTPNTHGTGCTFSAALAANLANGKQVQDAVVMAKAYLTAALKQSYAIGPGPGPLNHLYRLQEAPTSRNVDPAPQPSYTTR
ncbi:MAG: bifunctional hydroxymethylpyrimidine kinase/phosphomethylpyrimidine kinase [Acidobacteria bacterium]|nr:MAG: bifunctional hydroxymethylpyrimidine kinase/phosphomethylpyrimidine kinase [Acidobacteriota bacterium]